VAQEGKQSDWIGGGLKKVAEAAVAGLIGVAATFTGLAPDKDITSPKNWPLWSVLVLIFAAYQIFWPPLQRALQRALLRRRVPRGQPDKISILIARLQDDDSDALRDIVRDTIVQQLGDSVELIFWPEVLRVGEGRQTEASARARSTAQEWLKEKACDVLIWGRAKGDKAIALRVTAADGTDSALKSYGLTSDTLELPVQFISNFGSAIAARIVAGVGLAVSMSGHYLVPLMQDVAKRLEPIVRQLNPAFDSETRGSLLHSYALVRMTIGQQAGSNADLQQAVTAYGAALKEYPRDRAPQEWAMTQNNLGNALFMLGMLEQGTERLQQAAATYREVLAEQTQEKAPSDWARTQNNLGLVLSIIGEREKSATRLKEAVAAHRAALQRTARNREPLEWAAAQQGLGTALQILGKLENDTALLEQALAAYRAALEERKRELRPLDWAETLNNMGNTLSALGEHDSDTTRLDQALAAYHEALQERRRDRVPLDWAATQNNLGDALQTLGKRDKGTAHLEAAVAAYRAASQEFTRDRAPQYWEIVQTSLDQTIELLRNRRAGADPGSTA
jgi:tetratricopeptide (TPR) repeat protein